MTAGERPQTVGEDKSPYDSGADAGFDDAGARTDVCRIGIRQIGYEATGGRVASVRVAAIHSSARQRLDAPHDARLSAVASGVMLSGCEDAGDLIPKTTISLAGETVSNLSHFVILVGMVRKSAPLQMLPR